VYNEKTDLKNHPMPFERMLGLSPKKEEQPLPEIDPTLLDRTAVDDPRETPALSDHQETGEVSELSKLQEEKSRLLKAFQEAGDDARGGIVAELRGVNERLGQNGLGVEWQNPDVDAMRANGMRKKDLLPGEKNIVESNRRAALGRRGVDRKPVEPLGERAAEIRRGEMKRGGVDDTHALTAESFERHQANRESAQRRIAQIDEEIERLREQLAGVTGTWRANLIQTRISDLGGEKEKLLHAEGTSYMV
jgi:hypothetical protein